LDFEDAATVFAGAILTLQDDRRDYGEPEFRPTDFSVGVWSWWSGPCVARIAM
jgi:hypothetical protein